MQKTAYEMRISYWSSDVCSSDLLGAGNLDAVMRNYAEDAAFLVPNRPIILGKQAIREWFDARLATPGYHAKFAPTRSEERREGQACDSTCRSRRSPYHQKKQKIKKQAYAKTLTDTINTKT